MKSVRKLPPREFESFVKMLAHADCPKPCYSDLQ